MRLINTLPITNMVDRVIATDLRADAEKVFVGHVQALSKFADFLRCCLW